MAEWSKATRCRRVGVNLHRFESYCAQSDLLNMRRIIVAIFGLTQSGKTLLTQELEKPLANQGFMSLYASQLCRRYIQDNLTRPFWKKCSDFMARNRPLPSAALRFI